MKIKEYFLQVALAFDQMLNALLGGWADESLSSRSWRLHIEHNRTIPKTIINGIFFWQENHCREAYESELERLHVPPQMRKI